MTKFTSLVLTMILLVVVTGCDNYSHNSIVNTPPTNYINVVLTKTYGGPGYDWGTSIVVDSEEEEYYITGSTTSNGYGDNTVYLSKSDADGARLWYYFFGGWGDDNGEAVRLTADGNVIVAGFTTTYDLVSGEKIDPTEGKLYDDYNFYVIKTNTEGRVIWEKAFGDTTYAQRGTSLAEGADGYVIAGYESKSESDEDFYFVKVDFDGGEVWKEAYGTEYVDRAFALVRTYDGGYVAGGYTNNFSLGRTSPYLMKISGAGQMIWDNAVVDVTSNRQIDDLTETRDRGIAAVGKCRLSTSPPVDLLFAMKVNSNGELVWQNTYPQSRIARGTAIEENPDGTLTICGQPASLDAIHIAKLQSNGELLWCDSTVAPGYGMSIARCAAGYVVAGTTGYPSHQVLNDVLLLKLEEDNTNVE